MLSYPAYVFFDHDGYTIQFPDLSSMFSGGQSEREALARAPLALEEAIGRFAATWTPVPPPSPVESDQVLVPTRLLVEAKVSLLNAAAERSVTKQDLATRLGLTGRQVGLLCDPRHDTPIDAIAVALQALGRRLELAASTHVEPASKPQAMAEEPSEEDVAVRLAELEARMRWVTPMWREDGLEGQFDAEALALISSAGEFDDLASQGIDRLRHLHGLQGSAARH